MNQQIADQQQGQRAQYRRVAPVAASDDFAGDDGEKSGRNDKSAMVAAGVPITADRSTAPRALGATLRRNQFHQTFTE
jgi:hypothetical protein